MQHSFDVSGVCEFHECLNQSVNQVNGEISVFVNCKKNRFQGFHECLNQSINQSSLCLLITPLTKMQSVYKSWNSNIKKTS